MFQERLRLARKKAGLTMQELAGRITPPITAQSISKYESGNMMPSSDVLVELSRNLDVSLDFLMGGKVEAVEGIEFRKRSGATAQDRAAAEWHVIESLERHLMIEAILGIDVSPDPFDKLQDIYLKYHVDAEFSELQDMPLKGYVDAEILAQELRHAWQLGTDPIPDMTNLLESKDIRVIEADLPERFDGLACEARLSGDRPNTHAIVVSSHVNLERKRFSLAHELAHITLPASGNPDLQPEKAMDRFAGAFLVPAEHLQQEAGKGRDRIPYPELLALKHLYGVSATAMLMRLGQAGVLTEAAAARAFRGYARSWRKQEPDPLKGNRETFEKPKRFERLVWRSLVDRIINSVRAAKLLQQPLEHVENRLREALG